MVKTRVLASFICIGLFATLLLSPYSHVYAQTPNTPSSLPIKVQNSINSAVDIEYYNNGDTKIEKSSGVKISNTITISAGHEFLQNGPIQQANSNNSCRQLSLYSQGDQNTQSSTDKSIVATYSENDSSQTDISFINTSGDNNFMNKPVAKIGQKPNKGDDLYFVNYEPTSEFIDRNPNIDQDTTTKSNIYSSPAIYGGKLLDNTGNMYMVATGLNSFGNGSPEVMSRPGASGGPVFNKDGQLIGVIVSIVNEKLSANEVSSMYDVNLGNISPYTQLQIEEIQPVTPQFISDYQSYLNSNNTSITPASTSMCSNSPLIKFASFNKTQPIVKKVSLFDKLFSNLGNKTTEILASGTKLVKF